MSRDDFNDRLKRLGGSQPAAAEPQAPERPVARPTADAGQGARVGRIAAGVAGFALGTFTATANALYRDAVGTSAEADMLMGLVAFFAGTALLIVLVLAGLASLLFGKRWWGLWAFCGGYLAAFGIAGFISDFGSLGATT